MQSCTNDNVSDKDILTDTFNKNLQALSIYQKELYNIVKDYKVQRPFTIIRGLDGSFNLHFDDNDELFYVKNKPITQCTEQIDNLVKKLVYDDLSFDLCQDNFGQIHFRYANVVINYLNSLDKSLMDAKVNDIKAIPHCVLVGVGLGYNLGLLYERVEIANMVVIENDIDVLYASLYTFDYSSLLEFIYKNNSKITFIVGTNHKESFFRLFSYYYDYGYFLSGFKCVIATYINQDLINFIEQVYNKYSLINNSSGFFDDALFGISHGIYSITSKSNLVLSNISLKDDFVHLPVFIIGNGPSLDNDISFLRKNQDKALIIACGTAIDSLYNLGIKPDFYVATERPFHVAESLKIFDGTHFLDDITLLAANVVHPECINLFKDKLIFAKGNEDLKKILSMQDIIGNRFQNWAEIEFINPLVGNAGLSAALHLGFKNIYLFGIDNGKKEPNEYHATSSDIYNGNYSINKAKVSHTKASGKGNFGGVIDTNTLYLNSKEFIEIALDNFENVSCTNCSDGLYYNNTKPEHSTNIDFSDYQIIDKQAVKTFLLNNMSETKELSENEVKIIFDHNKFNFLADCIIKLIEKRSNTRSEQTYLLQTVSQILGQMVYGPDALYASTLNTSSQFFFLMATKVLYKIKDEESALNISFKILMIYKNFLEDCKYLFSFMPNYIEHNHLDLLKGQIGLNHKNSKAPTNFKPFTLFKGNIPKKTKPFIKRYY